LLYWPGEDEASSEVIGEDEGSGGGIHTGWGWFGIKEREGMTVVASVSVLINVVLLILFLRAKKLNQKMGIYEPHVKEWLEVHESLQRSSGCLLALKKVDPASVYYREPVRWT
jgi:hypothetical protein